MNDIKRLKVALVQKKARGNDVEANLNKGIQSIREAKAKGADIVLFPEMWSNGYAPPFRSAFDYPMDSAYEKERQEWLMQAVDEESYYIKSFRKVAKELEIGLVITYLSKGEKAPRNTALVIGKQGEILMKYDKVHTCDFSLEALLESGDEFKVCQFMGVQLGIMICYDREFPESARMLMLKGAEIILVPNACDMNPARINQLQTRAFENMIGIAMANYPGDGWGNSCAYSPIVFNEKGYVDPLIFIADSREEDIFVVEFEMEKIREYRQCETWGNAYRKVGTYGELLSKKVQKPFIR